MKLHRLPLGLLETLNDNLFILYKNIICPISMADLKIGFLSAIFKVFPAKGELLVILLDKKHCTEVCWWRARTRTALFALLTVILFPVF